MSFSQQRRTQKLTIIAQDPSVEEYVRTYRDLPDRQRQTLLSVVRATATALISEGPNRVPAPQPQVANK